jgi:hypothetical protein
VATCMPTAPDTTQACVSKQAEVETLGTICRQPSQPLILLVLCDSLLSPPTTTTTHYHSKCLGVTSARMDMWFRCKHVLQVFSTLTLLPMDKKGKEGGRGNLAATLLPLAQSSLGDSYSQKAPPPPHPPTSKARP